MKYAIVEADKAAAAGINLVTHRVCDGKTVLNENELRMLVKSGAATSNTAAAKALGATGLKGRLATREVVKFWRKG